MNIIGSFQNPEKFLPMTIKNVLEGKTVLIHSYPDGKRSGSRFYIHTDDVSKAVMLALETIEDGDKLNISGLTELTNLELAQQVASHLDLPLRYKFVDYHSSRPYHDCRYSLDGSKLKSLGFKFEQTIEQQIKTTVDWYLANEKEWL
jgi:dTDP-glucose 4,6-dehydratase